MKGKEFGDWIDRAFQPPEAGHVVGWCGECEEQVWIATDRRPFGMARTCEDHWPLSEFDSTGDSDG